MKKIFFSISLLSSVLFFESANAQEIGYGAKAGFNVASIRSPKTADIYSHKDIGSFNAQAYMDLAFTEGFSLQMGLAVSGVGSKITVNDPTAFTWNEYRSNPIYLQLPVNAIAKIPIGDIFDKTNIILGGGPYVAMGIAGKSKMTGKRLGVAVSREENFSFSNEDKALSSENYYGKFKNYDFGLNALVGIEYHWVTFNVNYGYGLVNVNPGANLSPIDRFKNRVWTASVGVIF